MNQPIMSIEKEDFRYQWGGGEYITIFRYCDAVAHREMEYYRGHWEACDIINVWDYVRSQPRINRTLEAFEQAVEKHIKEQES
jgi:hypothetical protein